MSPPHGSPGSRPSPRDLISGLVVFLVALPLCLGVALASFPKEMAPQLMSGLLAGIVGGILVGLLSGSHSSVSGPAAGLTAVVAAQLLSLGSFPTFLLALTLAGVIQIALGLLRAGVLAAFVPSSVIKGLLAAIGVILILKQIPHVVGYDRDPEGDFSFFQPDERNTITELIDAAAANFEHGAALVGILSVLLLIGWDRVKWLKGSIVPAPLVVVLFGVAMNQLFRQFMPEWVILPSQPGPPGQPPRTGHLVEVPVATDWAGMLGFFTHPDWSQLTRPAVYLAALTLAAVASLETLLNLEAVDKIDPKQRTSPPSRELVAQGVGNVVCGLIGGLPITSVIVRSSVNIHAGSSSKLSAVFHGVLLVVCVGLFPAYLNMIPLSCLAAILLVTGVKLASPKLVKQMWAGGKYQFAPFVITVLAIVFTDLLIGVLIGLAVSTGFILWSNVRRPLRRIQEKHLGGEVTCIVLANQVSFLNRAALTRVLDEVPAGGHVLLDAESTDYIDPDVLDLIRDFDETTGPARGIEVSLKGFRSKYQLVDRIQYADFSTRDLQRAISPAQVLRLLKDGNERFRAGRQLTRDLGRQVAGTADGQHPLAVVLSCIDSRAPVELLFDLGVGDVFVARVAGNIVTSEVLGSAEYATAVAGAKLVLVLGHTRCGAVTAAVKLAQAEAGASVAMATGCDHLEPIVTEIQKSIDPATAGREPTEVADTVARRNVLRAVEQMRQESRTLDRLAGDGKIVIIGGMYDVATGSVEFLAEVEENVPAVV